ncbi:TonB-dependent receptor domain-containing protein [uncultured Sphingomonas sp.]|uniref:TonB-dependent receptor domain-containing protein n=1 Tax=uncultured Sphingomonas sp. TaxID=158754 RepID=UPI0035C9ADBC
MFATAYTTADSETNTSYEAGVKTAFWDGRIHFNAAGFYYVVDNIQLDGNDANGNGGLSNASKGKGVRRGGRTGRAPDSQFPHRRGLSLLHTEIDDKGVCAQVGAANGVLSETVLDPTVRIGK